MHDELPRVKYLQKSDEGVSSEALDAFEKQFGFVLPDGYRRFMQESNGAILFVGEAETGSRIAFFDLNWVASNNNSDGHDYPGYVVFGSDGGGEAYAFDIRSSTTRFVRFPSIGFGEGMIDEAGETFEELLRFAAVVLKE